MRNLVIERILALEEKLFWLGSPLVDKIQSMSNRELLDLYSNMLLEYAES